MSQCLERSGWRKTRSDCRHTCVSVSAEASYGLGLRRVRGGVRRCFYFCGREQGSPLALDFFFSFFFKALAGFIFLNTLFNQRKLLLNTVHCSPLLPLHPLSRIWLISHDRHKCGGFVLMGSAVSFHGIGLAQRCAATQGQSFTNYGKWSAFVPWVFFR